MPIYTGPASSGGNPNVIWQWDGTLDDFTNGATPEVVSSSSASLSIVTSYRGNPALRMTAVGLGYASWAIDPAALSQDMPRRYTIEYEIEEFDNGAGTKSVNMRVGPALFCQYNGPGNILAYSACTYGNLANFMQVWTRNTTISSSGGTPTWDTPGTSTRRGVVYTVDVEMVLGATFDMHLKAFNQVATTNVTRWYNGDNLLFFDGTRFDNETPNTIGLSGSYDAAGYYCDITTFRVLKHPADR